MARLTETLSEKDAQIIALHNKSEDNLITVTSALTEATNQLSACAGLFKEFSDKTTDLSNKIETSIKTIAQLSKKIK